MTDFIKQWLDSVPSLPDTFMWELAMIVCVFRFYDAWKYHLQANKIRKVKTAKSQSRFFIDLAAGSDVALILWIIFKVKDTVLLITGLLALGMVIELFWVTYIYYDYKGRGLNNFKRPSVWRYFLNSLIPNSRRKRL